MSDFNDKVIQEFRATGGQPGGMFAKMGLILLTTTGAKTGEPRVSPIAYINDGDTVVVAASYGGGPVNPAWFNNLVKNPAVTVEIGSESYAATASVPDTAERDRLYKAISDTYPQFAEYETKTERKIPVVVLSKN